VISSASRRIDLFGGRKKPIAFDGKKEEGGGTLDL